MTDKSKSYFVYHGVPDEMVGHELWPLNLMPDAMLKVRKLHLAKYEGREDIMERRIPLLDCLWNDVVQFLPLHPRKVFELQTNLGLIPSVPPYRFFEINLEQLDADKAVVFFKTAPGEENTSVRWLRDTDWTTLQDIPVATEEYFKSLQGMGELPFNYQFVPHILYNGKLDISGAQVITL